MYSIVSKVVLEMASGSSNKSRLVGDLVRPAVLLHRLMYFFSFAPISSVTLLYHHATIPNKLHTMALSTGHTIFQGPGNMPTMLLERSPRKNAHK